MSFIDVLEEEIANTIAHLNDRILVCSNEQEKDEFKKHINYLSSKLNEFRNCLLQQRAIDRKLDAMHPMDDELVQLALYDSQRTNQEQREKLEKELLSYKKQIFVSLVEI